MMDYETTRLSGGPADGKEIPLPKFCNLAVPVLTEEGMVTAVYDPEGGFVSADEPRAGYVDDCGVWIEWRNICFSKQIYINLPNDFDTMSEEMKRRCGLIDSDREGELR